jgi:hypothetical protein
MHRIVLVVDFDVVVVLLSESICYFNVRERETCFSKLERNPPCLTLRFHDSKLVVRSHHGESKYAAPTWGNPASRRYCIKVKHKPPPAESPATMISSGAMPRSAGAEWSWWSGPASSIE